MQDTQSSKLIRLSSLGSCLLALLLIAGPARAWQDSPPSIQQLFESGKYQDIIDRANAQGDSGPDPADGYLVAQAHLKLQDGDGARRILERLAQRGETDPWSLVARSERARIDQNMDEALALAQAAAEQAPDSPYAFYQLGLVQSQRQDMPAAADAFEKAAALAPAFAYAHYYAGMAASAVKRIDRVASHFEAFLKLAPEAPERTAVESIMRTVRGK
jgi:tetratricopeptide (TPR) repeat protein